ncbi:hypothetical protein GCM10020000_53670 [Streptomyces olivoverticillatus]
MPHPERSTAVEIHGPQPITVHPPTGHLVPVQPSPPSAVQSIVLPDGRVVTGYTLTPRARPGAGRLAAKQSRGLR